MEQTVRILLALILMLLPGLVSADAISAEMVRISTPFYEPNFDNFEPPLGEYTYDVGWQGIPAATVKVKVEFDGLNYKISTKVKTVKFIDFFYHLRYQGEGLISAVDFSPIEAYIYHLENAREKISRLTFHADGNIESVRERKVGNDAPTLERLRFDPDNFTLDPFSAAFLVRSLNWKEGDVREFDTFNGKSRYLITLKCAGTSRIRIGGSYRDTLVLTPSIKNLTNPDSDKKFRSAKIFLSADKAREILKVESSVFVGKVTTKLESFVALPANRIRETLALRKEVKETRLE